jgi:TetR/AcrR family transcriptional regulator, regulator of cefoperazone and chloramphenicol sensitivity
MAGKKAPRPAQDGQPRERIRRAAMELYAERGQRGPTLRAVGERADVSPGLVQHHYKTTHRLMSEVQSWVSEQLAAVAADDPSGEGMLGSNPARYDEFLAANPVVAAYLRRGLLESAAPADWFRDAVAHRRGRFAEGDAESTDLAVAAAMITLVEMAPVLLGPLLEYALECDAAELSSRWRRVENAVLGMAFATSD